MAHILIRRALSVIHHIKVLAHEKSKAYDTQLLAITAIILYILHIISIMAVGKEIFQFIARDPVFTTVIIVIRDVIFSAFYSSQVMMHCWLKKMSQD
jgi:Ca2+:H+ antiporter